MPMPMRSTIGPGTRVSTSIRGGIPAPTPNPTVPAPIIANHDPWGPPLPEPGPRPNPTVPPVPGPLPIPSPIQPLPPSPYPHLSEKYLNRRIDLLRDIRSGDRRPFTEDMRERLRYLLRYRERHYKEY